MARGRPMRNLVPTQEIGPHMIHVPVHVGGTGPVRFIFDTGIGLTLVSSLLAKNLGLESTGETYTGKRMSGQPVSLPLVTLPAVSLGSCRRTDLVAGVFDLSLPPEMASIAGFLAPGFFGELPFTICRHSG